MVLHTISNISQSKMVTTHHRLSGGGEKTHQFPSTTLLTLRRVVITSKIGDWATRNPLPLTALFLGKCGLFLAECVDDEAWAESREAELDALGIPSTTAMTDRNERREGSYLEEFCPDDNENEDEYCETIILRATNWILSRCTASSSNYGNLMTFRWSVILPDALNEEGQIGDENERWSLLEFLSSNLSIYRRRKVPSAARAVITVISKHLRGIWLYQSASRLIYSRSIVVTTNRSAVQP
jgi:hypothetical protein